jgi:DNA-binding transcriptional MerR regulator
MEEFGSFSKEIAALLDISPNTLRRWSIDLEKKGYVFERNDKGQRIYYKRDVFALKKLQQLINERVTMENALSIVASEYNNKKCQEIPPDLYHDIKSIPKVISIPNKLNVPEQEINYYFRQVKKRKKAN